MIALVRLRRALDDDSGFSLTEILVAMAVMTTFMAIFTTSVLQLFSTSNHNTQLNRSSTLVNQAFVRLDRQVRYSSAIDLPNTTATTATGPWYVEFVNTTGANDQCTQLKMSGGSLFIRQWTGTTTAVSPTFSAIAGDLTPATANPFTLYAANGTQGYQRLAVSLGSTVGVSTAKSALSVTFAALNSSQSSTTNDRKTLVCQNAGGRP